MSKDLGYPNRAVSNHKGLYQLDEGGRLGEEMGTWRQEAGGRVPLACEDVVLLAGRIEAMNNGKKNMASERGKLVSS